MQRMRWLPGVPVSSDWRPGAEVGTTQLQTPPRDIRRVALPEEQSGANRAGSSSAGGKGDLDGRRAHIPQGSRYTTQHTSQAGSRTSGITRYIDKLSRYGLKSYGAMHPRNEVRALRCSTTIHWQTRPSHPVHCLTAPCSAVW